jgi:hypothetical protein
MFLRIMKVATRRDSFLCLGGGCYMLLCITNMKKCIVMLQMLVYGLMHAYATNEYCCLNENTIMKKI